MSTIRIEILNPNALKLIEGMQDLKLIKVSDEPHQAKGLSEKDEEECCFRSQH